MTQPMFSLCLAVAIVACGGKTPLKVSPQDDLVGGGSAAGDGGGDPAGGGEPAGGGGAPAAIPPICNEYCQAAALKGCPPAPGCEASCALLFPGECQDEIVAFLSCAPAQTVATCEIGYGADGPSTVCLEANDQLYACGSCEVGATSSTGAGCIGEAACGLTTRCDLDGACSCEVDGIAVGSCTAIIGGIDGCSPNLSCCRGFM